jgi:two-component system response regulator HydG
MFGRILLLEEDEGTARSLKDALQHRDFNVSWVPPGEEAIHALGDADWDVVVTDLDLHDQKGFELCTQLTEHRPDVPVVVVTGNGNFDAAVAAIRAGAYDFITKPIAVDSFVLALNRAIGHRQLTSEVHRLRAVVAQPKRMDDIIGNSPAIHRVFDLIERVADSDASVLITGESGTGKEMVARAVHARSNRSKQPFVPINCAAIPTTLMESELFGHVRGAFTDAKQARNGLFLQASGGTVFLDEISEIPLEMQAKLLRVLQDRRVRPVGGDTEVVFDARLITASNRDLLAEVEGGRFRSDLYYRINVVHIPLPPLRMRREDILLLAQHFVQKFAKAENKQVEGIGHAAAQKLRDYDWPGNVRELENCIERAIALTRMSEIGLEDLPERILEHTNNQPVPTQGGDKLADIVKLEEMELRYIRHVLSAVGGNKSLAARLLGLDRRSLYRRLAGHKQPAAAKEPTPAPD